MWIQRSALMQAAGRSYRTPTIRSLTEANDQGSQSAFLCHSHKDEALAEGLVVLLAENGWGLYVDWKDSDLPEQPSRETALKLKAKIVELDWFLFLATPNSSVSRWCPWEIGIADSRKPHGKILVIPTADSSGRWHGNEYLQLYNRIETADGGRLGKFAPGATSGQLVSHLR